MGVLSRLLNPERREINLPLAELDRMMDLASIGGSASAAGRVVSPDSALQMTAVYACVRVLAETVASLPLRVFRRAEAGGKTTAFDHPLYRILHDAPNQEMTSLELREVIMVHLALRGNAYCEIQRDAYTGDPLALWPLRPDRMNLIRNSRQQLIYEYQITSGDPKLFTANQILHVRGMGNNGLIGYSPIELCREAIGLGLATEEYGSRWFGNGARPSVVLTHPGQLGDEAFEHLQRSWNDKHQGLSNAQRVAILEEGMGLETIGVPPEDSQFLETRRFQVNEIARLFRIPPHMIGDLDKATFSNIEQQSIEFVVHTIRPWTERIEQRMEASLLNPAEANEYFVEHIIDGLLRGDIASRYSAYSVGRQWGWLSANDVRNLENLNPIDDGDIYLSPMNMISAGEIESQPEETPKKEETTARQIDSGETRAENARETRAVGRRKRLSAVGEGQIADAAQRLVNRESNDILNAARRFGRRPDGLADFRKWLNDFLDNHQPVVRERLWSATWALTQLAADEAHQEAQDAGHEGALDEEALRRFGDDYMGSRATGWVAMLRSDLYDGLDRADKSDGEQTRAAEPDPAWLTETEAVIEKRRQDEADMWGRDEANRIVNAVAVTVWAAVGVMFLRWASNSDCCPFCSKMNGRTIGIAQWFLQAGEGVDIEGLPSLRPGSNMRHPPLHRGCECGILIG